ncbi:MAG: hypothetical protein MMC23_008836 [Stictis urceolatum]|nr:hypothetical protein [Stictis urceolata]
MGNHRVSETQLDPSLGDPALALRNAWKTLRYDHPEIATTLENGTTKVYDVPKNDADVKAWLDETFVVSSCPDVDALNSTLEPYLMPRLFYLPSFSGCVLRISHWRIDGMGCQLLIRALLQALVDQRSNIVFGSEPDRLSSGFDEVVQTPPVDTSTASDAATRMIQSAFAALPTVEIPVTHQKSASPTAFSHQTISIDSKTASSILSGCKAHPLSFTAALQAAVVVTTYELTKEGQSPKDLPPSSEFFFETAKTLNSRYKARHDEPYPNEVDPPFLSYNAQYLAQHKAALSMPRPARDPNATREAQPWIGSLGKIETKITPSDAEGTVKWSDFVLHLDIGSADISLHVWSERGELKLDAGWNEAYWSREDVEKVMRHTLARLEKEVVAV